MLILQNHVRRTERCDTAAPAGSPESREDSGAGDRRSERRMYAATRAAFRATVRETVAEGDALQVPCCGQRRRGVYAGCTVTVATVAVATLLAVAGTGCLACSVRQPLVSGTRHAMRHGCTVRNRFGRGLCSQGRNTAHRRDDLGNDKQAEQGMSQIFTHGKRQHRPGPSICSSNHRTVSAADDARTAMAATAPAVTSFNQLFMLT